MRLRKPENLTLAVVIGTTLTLLAVFTTDLTLAYRRDLAAGERRLQQFSAMMAEHTARSFETVDLVVREIALDLSTGRTDWRRWNDLEGYNYLANRQSRAMPQLRELLLFDPLGNQRFQSTHMPANAINVADRPYFLALTNGAPAATYGPFVGRNSGLHTYGLAHRIHDADGHFNGAAFAALEPSYMQEFCWANRMADVLDAVLVNQAGLIVTTCRPTDLGQSSPIIGRRASDLLAGGQLAGRLPERGVVHMDDWLVAASPVPGFADLRFVAVLPTEAVLAAWSTRRLELGLLGLLLSAVLLSGGLVLRRHVAELSRLNTAQREAQAVLEERIEAATGELALQKESAERANLAKSRFLAAASHDLRQPLHALALFSTELKHQLSAGQARDLSSLASHIGASTRALGEMLDALLDVSRLDIEGVKPELRVCPLGPLFERLAIAFGPAAAQRGIRLRIHPTHSHLHTDPALLERILSNLLSNAVRYTRPGGRILVGARWRGDQVRIEVRDNGIGIAREHREAIFAEFYQVANAAREQHGGLGLGLSIVDRLAKALNIPIDLRSEIGHGTAFALSVPRGIPQAPRDTPNPRAIGQIYLAGGSVALEQCRSLANHWHYAVNAGPPGNLAHLPAGTLVLCEIEAVPTGVREDCALIVLLPATGDFTVPASAHALRLPIKPARLRAMLRAATQSLLG